jgi:3-hydroxybutyrate dehydrogenase
MTDLEGRTALVTGSVQGIGLAIAGRWPALGARIAVHGLADAEQAAAAEGELEAAGAPEAGSSTPTWRTPTRIADLMAAVAAWGGADILVNNAGIQQTAPLADMPRDAWDSASSR